MKTRPTALHTPVLLAPFLEMIAPLPDVPALFLDGTFGRGGHTRAILEAKKNWRVLGLDCDQEAIDYGRVQFANEIQAGRLDLRRANFSDFSKELGGQKLIGGLLDLGVSSPQLDEGRRGFSFYHHGPLDMRMDQTNEMTAARIVNNFSEQDLNDIFNELGEVRRPFRVSQKICETRKEKAFETTQELAALIEKVEGWRQKGHHPATNYFMALRIAVNGELKRIEKVLPDLAAALLPEGRLFVITFHSLEDRIVKTAFRALDEAGAAKLVNKKVVQAEWEEKKTNPRARSAKMRVIEGV
jgi:16S rRNA (cytosine1402-N4)-methyltransferase